MPFKHTLLSLHIIIYLIAHPFTTATCPESQYTNPTGQCTQCPFPESYSVGGSVTVCSMCAPGTMVSGTSCVACTAGKFSATKASITCQSCPSGTASVAGSSSCVRCDATGAARLANGITAGPTCTSTCSACVAGKYNDGTTKKCSSCAAGKFSTATQAVTPNTCSPCSAGQTTLPTTTGASSCIPCSTPGLLAPHAADFAASTDPLVCSWRCSPGYTRFNYSETAYVATAFTSLGYTTSQALAIFHNKNDFCCEPSSVLLGMYMCGTALPACTTACSRTSDGNSANCALKGNSRFVMLEKYKFNRCDDWVCDDFFFFNQSAGVCTPQPVCQTGYTYQRDTTIGSYSPQPSGSFTCVPCSRCIDGSETELPCNRFNDTVCRLCSPTEFSYHSGPCTPTIPMGYGPVRIRITSVPLFQGRPSVYYDSLTPVVWNSIDYTQGFFLNSYTPCQPLTSTTAVMYTGNDDTCNRLDMSLPSVCLLPICKTQCKPWNGVEGWYKLKTGDCSKCVYDSTCTSQQYSDMTTCGPTTAPKCTACPGLLLPNSLGWLNPGRTPFPGPYPCDIICRDGYAKGGNYSCISCPAIPSNSKFTIGCNWTCSLGFIQDGISNCIPCVGVPTECTVGYYIGYATALSQCARCLPCTNIVANSVYTSAGQPSGPNTCGIKCIPETFVSPGYGFDSYSNPIACDHCSTLSCVAGDTYLQPCSLISDAVCTPCSQCEIGTQVSTDCTIATNTVCAECNSSSLPDNATWTESGCKAWACDEGYVLRPNTTQCIKCKIPRDCIYSDSFADDGTGCGRCVACDLFLLLPGQCFNGDGQCGVSYLCDVGMIVGTDTTAIIPPPQAAESAELDQVIPAATTAFASMATLTITAELSSLTASFIEDLSTQTSANCACEATVTSVTQGNVTTFCTPSCILSPSTRRMLLLHESLHSVSIDIALVGNPLVTIIPGKPVFDSQHVVLAWQTYEYQTISDPTLLSDRRRLVVQFKRTGYLHTEPLEPDSDATSFYYIAICVVLAVIIVSVLAACGRRSSNSSNNNHHRESAEDEDRVSGNRNMREGGVRERRGQRGHQMKPPHDYNGGSW